MLERTLIKYLVVALFLLWPPRRLRKSRSKAASKQKINFQTSQIRFPHLLLTLLCYNVYYIEALLRVHCLEWQIYPPKRRKAQSSQTSCTIFGDWDMAIALVRSLAWSIVQTWNTKRWIATLSVGFVMLFRTVVSMHPSSKQVLANSAMIFTILIEAVIAALCQSNGIQV